MRASRLLVAPDGRALDARTGMDVLIILTADARAADGTANALQLALTMTRRDDVTVRLFLTGDAVVAAKAGSEAPDGTAGSARTLRSLVMSGVELAVCDVNLAARGIADDALIVGATISPMSRLADWALAADRVLTF